VRQPLSTLTVLTRDDSIAAAVESHIDIIIDELNVKTVATSSDESKLVTLSAKANFKKLGPELGKGRGQFAGIVVGLSSSQIETLIEGRTIDLGGRSVTIDDIVVEPTPLGNMLVETGDGFAVALDTSLTAELVREGFAREVISNIQSMRRDMGLKVIDRIVVKWDSDNENVVAALGEHSDRIQSEVLATTLEFDAGTIGDTVEVDGLRITVSIAAAN
jgi:isoleucyl-tRNA synthetase